MIFTDTIPVNKRRDAAEKAIKVACRTELETIPFEIFHHPEESNNWIQVADYCTWAVARKWERKDTRTYLQILPRLHAPELDALRSGGILPAADDLLAVRPASPLVNSVKNEGPNLLEDLSLFGQ